jgi:hypothetical protein
MADAIDNGWDHKIVFPIIQKYLSERKFPHAVTTTAIYDAIITEPIIQEKRIIRLEWCINYALRNLGYRKDSRTGRGYTKSNLGILVPC